MKILMNVSDPNRAIIAKAIRVTVRLAALVVIWQAVRFCQGHAGAPVLDQILAILQDIFEQGPTPDNASNPLQFIMAWFWRLVYYLYGIMVWLGITVLVLRLGFALARIVEVGFKRYIAELNRFSKFRKGFPRA